MVTETSKADILLSNYDHLTNLGGQRGGCQQLSQQKGACFLLNKKEALSGLIQVNDDEENKGGQRESMVATNRFLEVSNPGLQMIGSNECLQLARHLGLIPVYRKNSFTLLFSGLRSSWAAGILSTLFSV